MSMKPSMLYELQRKRDEKVRRKRFRKPDNETNNTKYCRIKSNLNQIRHNRNEVYSDSCCRNNVHCFTFGST